MRMLQFPFRNWRELTNISQVKNGGTTTLTLDPGPKYHGILLKGDDFALSDILEIRVKANSEVIHRYSGTHLDFMNRISGLQASTLARAANGGFLWLGFDRPNLRDRMLEQDGAINTGQPDPETGDMITVLKVEIQFKSDPAAYTPALSAKAAVSRGTNEGPGTIRRILTTTRQTQGAGRVTWSDFEAPGSKFAALARTFIIPDANAINEAEVFRKQDSVFLLDAAENDYLLGNGYGGRQPVAGVFPIMNDQDGYGGNVMNLAGVTQGDYRIKVEASGAMTATLVMEYLGRLR